MNDRWLKSFIITIDQGSIRSAAEKLYISPQALIQQLNSLENEVGVPLLLRKSTGVTPTTSGVEFYKAAKHILEHYEITMNKCRKLYDYKNVIRIPVSSSLVIPEFMEATVAEYKKNYPDLFDIQFIPQVQMSTRLNGLLKMDYDLIEYYTVDGYHPKGVYYEKLIDIEPWCLMSQHHPLAENDVITLEDLDNQHIVCSDFGLIRHFQIAAENADINIRFTESKGEERYQVFHSCNSGALFLINSDLANDFPGYKAARIDFDTHIQNGLACRIEMKDAYKEFFETAQIMFNKRKK